MENRYQENFRVLVDEAHTQNPSVRWEAAVRDLRRVHRDLPDVVMLAAKNLPAAEPGMLAARLSNTAPRELAGTGKEELTKEELILAVRRTHRSVAIQEVASGMISEREGMRGADDFLSLRRANDDIRRTNHSAGVATEALSRQGIDARRLLGHMTPAELKAVSVGAYDRVGDDNRDRLAAALEIDTGEERQSMARTASASPVMRSPRTQFAGSRRQPTFGRRMEMAAHAQAMSGGMGR